MISQHSRKIATSFSVVLGLLLIMILFDLSRMNIMHEKLDVIVKEHSVKSGLMMVMRHGIYNRQISLRNILLMNNPFDRDGGKTIFNSFALDILNARNKFSNMSLNNKEKILLEEINKEMVLAYQAQLKLIDQSIYNETFKVTQEVINTAFLTQEAFSNKLNEMISLQKNATKKAVMDAGASYSAAKKSVYVLGGSALFIGIIVALFIIRLTESQAVKVNQAIADLEDSRERLEERVKNRTEQLALIRDQALASNKAKDTFLATMI